MPYPTVPSPTLYDIPDSLALIVRTLQDQSDFPGLSRSWNFQEKIQDLPGGVGTV